MMEHKIAGCFLSLVISCGAVTVAFAGWERQSSQDEAFHCVGKCMAFCAEEGFRPKDPANPIRGSDYWIEVQQGGKGTPLAFEVCNCPKPGQRPGALFDPNKDCIQRRIL